MGDGTISILSDHTRTVLGSEELGSLTMEMPLEQVKIFEKTADKINSNPKSFTNIATGPLVPSPTHVITKYSSAAAQQHPPLIP